MKSNLSKYFKYENMSIGISQRDNKYTFFVIDKNVTWHADVYFKNIETTELAAKQYVQKMLNQDFNKDISKQKPIN